VQRDVPADLLRTARHWPGTASNAEATQSHVLQSSLTAHFRCAALRFAIRRSEWNSFSHSAPLLSLD
jgi:hypothetical protein